MSLTQTDGSQESQTGLRGEAGREERLQHVVGEGEGDDSLVGGVDHQHSNPQPQEPAGRTGTHWLAWQADRGISRKSRQGTGMGVSLEQRSKHQWVKGTSPLLFSGILKRPALPPNEVKNET